MPAKAGHYNVVYSGGSSSNSGGSHPYGIYGFGWGGSASDSGMTGATSSSGTITATFTWSPDYDGDVPPLSAIIYERCSAGAASYYGSTGADDGLGDAPTVNYYSKNSNGVRWSVHTSNASNDTFSITCSPSSYAVGPYSVTSSVQYSASAIPVVVGVSGTTITPDHVNHILIGQGCVPSLPQLNGVTFQNYNWTVTGNRFKYYEAHGHDTGHFARITYMDATDWHQANPHFYWKAGDCVHDGADHVIAQADAYAQNSQGATVYIGTVLGVKDVNVWTPYYACGYSVGMEQLLGPPAAISAGSNSQPGIQWTAHCIPPDLFNLSGQGIWAFNQIIDQGRYYTDTSGRTYGLNDNGKPGLDDSYPYPFPDPTGLNHLPVTNAQGHLDDSNLGMPDDNRSNYSNDSPRSSLDSTVMATYYVSDTFQTYMVYRPGDVGFNHNWVPLHLIAWQWSPSIVFNGTNWVPTVPLKPIQVTADQRYTIHPYWESVIYASDLSYVPF